MTIIVLAIGVLGLAGLQMASIRSNHSAFLRTQATLAANDLTDRMRMNPGDFAGKTLSTSSGSQSAVSSFNRWATSVATMMPPGTVGQVDCPDSTNSANGCPAGHCEVTISWDDSRADAYQDRDVLLEVDNRDTTSLTFRVCTRLPAPR